MALKKNPNTRSSAPFLLRILVSSSLVYFYTHPGITSNKPTTLLLECFRPRIVAKEERAFTSRAFSAYFLPLDMVTSFRYLGRVILVADDNWPEVVRNLSRTRAMWKRMTRILSKKGAELRVFGFFFKAMVQAVFIFG